MTTLYDEQASYDAIHMIENGGVVCRASVGRGRGTPGTACTPSRRSRTPRAATRSPRAPDSLVDAAQVTTGASNDLQQVRNIARRMVAQWGFSKDSLSPTAWEPAESPGMFAGQRPV